MIMKSKSRIVIGRNEDLLRNAQQEARERNRIISSVNLFFQRYKLQPLHPKEFEGVNFAEVFASRYFKTNSDAYPKHLTPMEVIKTAGIELSELRQRNTEWKKLHLPFDFDTLNVPTNLDVNIYAANEKEEHRFNAAQQLATAYNTFFAECGRPMLNNTQIRITTGNALTIDSNTYQIKVNANWVQQLFM
jgi:hypothetical protein